MINSNILSLKSTIDCKNEEIFVNYVKNNYDTNLLPISGKLYHTLRVTKNCKFLAKSLNLDEIVGTNIGLFHDFARFEQWNKYSCFVDYKTEDHADMATDLLFNKNYISMFDIPTNSKPIIYYSVKYHNKGEIDFEKIKLEVSSNKIFEILNINEAFNIDLEEIFTYCKIARDGDKIDLINRIIAGEFKISYEQNGYTPNCLNRIAEKKYVILQDISTKLDRIFCFIGFLYDLNFSQSFELFSLDDFFNSLVINYKSILTDEDLNLLKIVIEKAKINIIEKYNLSIKKIQA